jgi:hypothetical protein
MVTCTAQQAGQMEGIRPDIPSDHGRILRRHQSHMELFWPFTFWNAISRGILLIWEGDRVGFRWMRSTSIRQPGRHFHQSWSDSAARGWHLSICCRYNPLLCSSSLIQPAALLASVCPI